MIRGHRDANDTQRFGLEAQIITILLAILIVGITIYTQHLTTEIDRLIDTQRAELQRISTLETQAKYNADAIASLDNRLRREVEIPQYCRSGVACP